MATDEKGDATVSVKTANRCANCRASITGHFCSECGAPLGANSNTYLLLADSFFKLGEIKRYILRYCRIIASPTRRTIQTFEEGHLNDGIRFLEYGVSVYMLAFGVSGLALFNGNEFVKETLETLWLFVTYSVTYALYYMIMRSKGAHKRTSREFLLFSCLTLGFTLPVSVLQLFGALGSVAMAASAIPLIIYMVRSWKHFWGASGTRVFWTLIPCGFVGSLAGMLVLIPAWMAFGIPTS